MRIARVLVAEHAAPVLALVVDGAVYDVAKLEERWGLAGMFGPVDFHVRVVGARGAGLDLLEARLVAGDRPTEARLWPGEYLPLAPCDPQRAAYLQMAPYQHAGSEPCFQKRDSRSLVGHDQPVSFPWGAERPWVEAGLGLLLAEDLYRADAREAERAIAGVTLLLDWTAHPDRWERLVSTDAPSQLGSVLLTGPPARQALRASATVRRGDRTHSAGGAEGWRFHPGESLAYLSQHLPLSAGDVVGAGCFAQGRLQVGWGERVTVRLDRLLSLSGQAAPGPPPRDWRLKSGR